MKNIKMSHLLKIFLMLISLFIFVTGCNFLDQKDQIIIGINQIKTLNPFLSNLQDEKTINHLIYGSLFTISSKNSKFEPFIAKRFSLSKNIILIEINKDIFDSAGNLIDANFLSRYFNYFQKRINGDDDSFIPDVKGLIIDSEDNNLVIKFDESLTQIEKMQKVGHLFVFPILSPEILDIILKKQEAFYQYGNLENYTIPIISTGKWKIIEIDPQNIKIEKRVYQEREKNKNIQNEDKKKVILFRIIKDSNIILQNLINKEIDICFGDKNDAKFMENFYSIKSIQVNNPESFYVLFFNFQSTNPQNKDLIINFIFRKFIYDIISYNFKTKKINSEFYIMPSHLILRKFDPVGKSSLKEFNEKIGDGLFLYTLSDDQFGLFLMQNIIDIFTYYGINIKCYSENLNNMIARIYATKNWDLYISSLSIDYPFLIDLDLFNPFSYQHIFNINLDKNNDLLLGFENEIYNMIEQNSELILKNPAKIYKNIEQFIIKNYYFIPLAQDRFYIFYNRNLKIKYAEIINKGFFIYSLFE